jgi:DNA repair photolyase
MRTYVRIILQNMRGVEVVEQRAKSVINAVAGMPFKWSINPYRGCYHQCRFCYARRSHTYLEEDGVARWGSRLFVKINAAAVVRSELAKRSWKRESIAIGTVTDPYQPIEGRYRITRGILEALRDYQSPAGITTRSPLVVRDIDVLQELSRVAHAGVSISIATLDEHLAREIEPTVAPPLQRLRAVRLLAEAGICVNVALAPVLPNITDAPASIEAVVRAAREAGAAKVWHNTLYLHDITRESFFNYLREYRPELIATYAQLYRGTYAPRVVAKQIDEHVADALDRNPPRAMPRIACRVVTQLSLI